MSAEGRCKKSVLGKPGFIDLAVEETICFHAMFVASHALFTADGTEQLLNDIKEN